MGSKTAGRQAGRQAGRWCGGQAGSQRCIQQAPQAQQAQQQHLRSRRCRAVRLGSSSHRPLSPTAQFSRLSPRSCRGGSSSSRGSSRGQQEGWLLKWSSDRHNGRGNTRRRRRRSGSVQCNRQQPPGGQRQCWPANANHLWETVQVAHPLIRDSCVPQVKLSQVRGLQQHRAKRGQTAGKCGASIQAQKRTRICTCTHLQQQHPACNIQRPAPAHCWPRPPRRLTCAPTAARDWSPARLHRSRLRLRSSASSRSRPASASSLQRKVTQRVRRRHSQGQARHQTGDQPSCFRAHLTRSPARLSTRSPVSTCRLASPESLICRGG
jgi:hypothetical protein